MSMEQEIAEDFAREAAHGVEPIGDLLDRLEGEWGDIIDMSSVREAYSEERARRIHEIASDCADEAADVAADGQLEVADPMRGDWEHVEDKLGELSDDERDQFWGSYRRRLERHVDEQGEPGPARLESRFSL